ncbi:MAG: UvrD-helicase domain-containing protein [Bacteroidota bacterium]
METARPNSAFKIYKSSAGSGKTFTLVKEFLGVVLRDPRRYRNVLAITFTNKAAGEMKERIIGELRALAAGEDGPMFAAMVEEFTIPPENIQANAIEVLARVLHDYGNFSVSTIDSFTHRLIRSFAKDLDLPSRFDVETEVDTMLARMIDQLMDGIGRDPYVTDILVRFVAEKLKQESGWNVDRDVTEVARQLFYENSKPFLNQLKGLEQERFVTFIEYIKEQAEIFPERMKMLGEKGEALIRQSGIALESFAGGSRTWARIFGKLTQRKTPTGYRDLLESKSFVNAYTNQKWAKKDTRAQIEAVMESGLRQVIEDMLQFHAQEFERYLTAAYAYENIHSMAVIKQVEDLLELHKTQNSLVHISDFQNKIAGLLQEETPDYIYWRLGERFRHYLLDEFQDTSLLQWVNLQPLLQYIRQDVEAGGSLLLVGDSKQAIYRWRGGEVDLLEVVAPVKLDVEPRILGRNYRSKEYVVDFNNRFFGAARDLLQSNEDVRQIYTDFEQKIRPGNEGEGFVQVAMLEEGKIDEFRERALERTLDTILDLRREGYRLKDIALLVRRREEGTIAAQYLSENGIRVISSESIVLHLEPVVGFIVSLFRFLVDATDAIARAEILHYFLLYLHRDKELNVRLDERIRELLQDEKPIQAVFEQLPVAFKKLSYKLDQMPLYELTEEIVQIFDLRSVAPAFVQHFLDVVLEFSERKKPDLGEFIRYWDDKKEKFSVVVPEGEEAVEIITIHKSKGLEYPVVILPFVNWSIQPKADSAFWANAGEAFPEYPDAYLVPTRKDLEVTAFRESYTDEVNKTVLDNLNLLYVAFTRPRERLYIYLPKPRPRKSAEAPTQKDMRRASDLINFVLEEPGFDRADEDVYESGFPIPPGEQSTGEGALQAPEFISERWRDRIRIERNFKKYWESGEGQIRGDISEATVMGEVLRNLSESENLPLFITEFQENGLIDEAQKDRIEEHLDRMLMEPPLRDWFDERYVTKKKAEVLSPSGKIYAADRVVLDGKEKATLINFVDSERGKPDREGLKHYRATLLDLGWETVDAYLFFLPEGNVEKI